MATKYYCDKCGEEMPNDRELFISVKAAYNVERIVKKKVETHCKDEYLSGSYCKKCAPIILDKIYEIFSHEKRTS